MKKTLFKGSMVIFLFSVIISLYSCNSNPINVISDLISNNVTAKDRLDSANAQAYRRYGPSANLVMILGRNVSVEPATIGRTDISIITGVSDPNSLGAWLYIYKKPGSDTLAVYTPDPTPGQRNCIELTSLVSLNTILSLLPDTSARNIISGAIQLINNSSFKITTSSSVLIDSDSSYSLAYNTSPVIKFDNSFVPSSSSTNGSKFFTQDVTGATKTANMFLIPALGALNLPSVISSLTGFPNDVWVVNFKKKYTDNSEKSLVFASVVQSNQTMGIPFLTLLSRVINISKYVTELP